MSEWIFLGAVVLISILTGMGLMSWLAASAREQERFEWFEGGIEYGRKLEREDRQKLINDAEAAVEARRVA
jgi:flagellar basal body-associated protein FliL